MDTIPLELQKLGLKEKEVKIYLAGLKLGPTSVQNIAKASGVTRPTAYEIIKTLEQKGLFAETIQSKKRYFLAQSPDKILDILRLQKREAEEKEREFIRIIASLESKYSNGDQEEIKTFKGKEGLKALEETISFTSSPEIFIVSSEASKQVKSKRKELYEKIKKRLGSVKIKETHSPALFGTLIIFDKVVFFSAKKQEGYLIENPLVISIFKSIFR